jgi:hypothetical protein
MVVTAKTTSTILLARIVEQGQNKSKDEDKVVEEKEDIEDKMEVGSLAHPSALQNNRPYKEILLGSRTICKVISRKQQI